MHIRCPHCHNAIEVVGDQNHAGVVCSSCGSSFNLVGTDTTATYHQKSSRIAHFELVNLIGMGQFGAVWKARDTQLDRLVAIKIPRLGPLDPDDTEMFLREARAAAQLKHPSIVSVHEIGRDHGQVYIVSDFVLGANLKEWLSGKRLSWREAAELCAAVADALHHAHEAGVVHRDIKPSNIMIDDLGQPHLMDFGLAKRETGEITMTMDGRVIGTPAYMSPEQAAGKSHQADRRADIYSLGVILFELLTGELPFRGDKEMLLVQIRNEDPPHPRKLNSRIPRPLETICLKALRKEPDRRYATAAALAADLRRWLNGEPILARPMSRIEKSVLWCRRHPATLGWVVSLLVVLAAATSILVWQKDQHAKRRDELLVKSVLVSRPDAVPLAIDNLMPIRSRAMPLLRAVLDNFSLAVDQRMRAAFALAQMGDVQAPFLVQQIETAPAGEVENLISALSRSRAESVRQIQFAAIRHSDPHSEYTVRLAIVALHLGDFALADDLCKWRPDPVSRTKIIETVPNWHGELSSLVDSASRSDSGPLISAICLGIGSIPRQQGTAMDGYVVNRICEWLRTSADAAVHSASGWALQQWNSEFVNRHEPTQPDERLDWHRNSLGITMLRIPAGRFQRQAVETDSTEPANQVKGNQEVILTRRYLLSDREISVGQYQRFIDDLESATVDKPLNWDGAHLDSSPSADHPVQQVNWYDAAMFCNWLSRREGLRIAYEPTGAKMLDSSLNPTVFDELRPVPDADGYRLPTDAEWEFACRAAASTRYCFGHDPKLLDRYAVYRLIQAQPCGNRLPNAFGLFDMHGNVWEWCQDWYAAYGAEREVIDPVGPALGETRSVRGGAFVSNASYLQSANRIDISPISRNADTGFRIARTSP